MNKDLQVGMWNVLSLYRSGALQNLTQVTQEYKTDLLAIQEVRWLGRSIIKKKDCTVYYSCDDKQHIYGTNIRLITDFKICVLQIRGKFKNYSYICAHAPTNKKSERK
jgi:hypothetical protein